MLSSENMVVMLVGLGGVGCPKEILKKSKQSALLPPNPP